MAYAFTVHGPEPLSHGIVRYRVVETEVATTSEWRINLASFFKGVCHIQLLEADVIAAGAGPIATIQPELGTVATWTSGERGHVTQVDTAAANVRVGEYKNVSLRDGYLYGRSTPDTSGGAGSQVETVLLIAPGTAI